MPGPKNLGSAVFFPYKALVCVCRCLRILRGVTMGRAFAFAFHTHTFVKGQSKRRSYSSRLLQKQFYCCKCFLGSKDNLVSSFLTKMWHYWYISRFKSVLPILILRSIFKHNILYFRVFIFNHCCCFLCKSIFRLEDKTAILT